MLKDTEGNENLIKVKTEDGKIVERENVELADEKVKEIPQAGTYVKEDEVADVPGQIEKGTLKAAEQTDETETLPEDAEAELKPEDEKPEVEIELGKKMEEMAYRIEEMEKKMAKMEAMMPPVNSEVTEEEAGIEMSEEEELPKLDGAPIEEQKFATAETNRKNYGKKTKDAQSSFLSKLYK
jgi:hypothetical protein